MCKKRLAGLLGLVLLVSIACTACGRRVDNLGVWELEKMDEDDRAQYIFEEGEKSETAYQKAEVEIDAELARKLADYAIEEYWGENACVGTKYEVLDYEEEPFYIVSRTPLFLWGASYEVCIDKEDGEILSIKKEE